VTVEATALVERSLYQLPNPYQLDGRVTSHPATARGWAPLNIYLLLEGGRACLVDSGFSVHEEAILRQLASLIDEDTPLEFVPTAIGEFGSICNMRAITDRFNVVRYHGILENASVWMDVRAGDSPYGGEVGGGSMAQVENALLTGPFLDWAGPRRPLEVFLPPFFLLPFKWVYDEATGTLFSGDMFGHVWRDSPGGPWTIQPGEAPPSLDDVYDFMTRSRWWWLPGGETESLEAGLVELFDRLDVRIIAPRYGCVINGADAVGAHLELVLDVLRRARREPPIGVTVSSTG
jgi:hypothetical protein